MATAGLLIDLSRYGYVYSQQVNAMVLIDKPCVDILLQDDILQPFQSLDVCPRSSSSQGASLCTYKNWFAKPEWQCNDFLVAPVHISLMRQFLQFRTGCHQLPIVTGRMLNIPRHQRLCLACRTSSVCDELHLVFECPSLQNIRQNYQHLFPPHITTMKQFVWQDDVVQIMLFLRDCLSHLLG